MLASVTVGGGGGVGRESLFQSVKRLNRPVHYFTNVFIQDAGYQHGKTVFQGWVRGNKLPDIFREHPSRGHMTHVYASGQAPVKVMKTTRGTYLKPARHGLKSLICIRC